MSIPLIHATRWLAPLGEAAVGGEDHGALLVAGVDQLEEQIAGAGAILPARNPLDAGRQCRHRTSVYLNNRLDQDHRGIKGRILGARPTIVLHSGSLWTDPETGGLLPKGHAHWRLAQPARGPEQLRLLRRARDIATLLAGGDPSATPPVHPMRWPGTWNLKTDRPVMARIVEENDSTIDLADALAALEEAAQLANLTTPRNVPHLAQPDTTPAEVAQIADWLSFYPNTGALQWNDWNSCAMAIHRVTGGSEAGFEAFRTWSATSAKHSDADCRARWDAITGSPATWIGANHLRRKATVGSLSDPGAPRSAQPCYR